ncbi:MAG: GldG family protein [Gammaproteobacteria bacterium]|jgi:ABC-type uncharacterized transport system involved in gliding motility auxiliary subunit|nr:GldG family protein [Gammaproteobacteria bacterium]
MRVTRKSRLRLRLENLAFHLLFLGAVGLAAYLTTRYHIQVDWTASGRNTLSEASQTLLGRLDGPVAVTAYAREDEVLRGRVRDLVERYRRHKPDLSLSFVNPDTAPDRVRELGIAVDGELVVDLAGRKEHVQTLSEQALTNALQRVARGGDRYVVFLTGHGERDPRGQANHDLRDWARQLEQRGLRVETVNLAETGAVPGNTSVLVIAGPQARLLPGEVEILRGYLDRGGNLLWLADPGDLRGLEPLAEPLGLELQPGTIVDPTTQLFGIDNPAMTLITQYPLHPVTERFDLVTVFPMAAALTARPSGSWQPEPLLTTAARAWSETGELAGEVRLDPGKDVEGPLDVGFALTRPREGSLAPAGPPGLPAASSPSQRVAVVGDGDFLSNSFLGNGGNLDLGLNLVNWLSSDDELIAIPATVAPDTRLVLSDTAVMVIGVGFLAALPLGLALTGVLVWYRRRRR